MLHYRLQAPTGAEIIGTEETISAVARIGNIRPDGKGGFDFEHTGKTELDEHSHETMVSQGQVVYRDENGSLWLERELILMEMGRGE
jgi:hypothetical protein